MADTFVTLMEARKALNVAKEKIIDPTAREFIGNMEKVTLELAEWSQKQSMGGSNV